MLNIKRNIEAIQRLYFAQGDGLDAQLRHLGKADLANQIKKQLAQTLNHWPVEVSLFELLQTKQGYQSVLAQLNKLEQLNYLIHEKVAIELGIVLGFNATDGD